jgi:Glycosyl hydrolases family 16
MKTLLLLLALAPLLPAQKPPEKSADNWVLTFDEEFSGKEVDLSHWIPHAPGGVTHSSAQPITVSGGKLRLAGTISTFGLFAQMYGRFEIRFCAPKGPGLRPAFLLLPVPAGTLPAIQVFETTGTAPSRVFFADRWGSEQTERSFGDSFTVPDLSEGFHTVAVEWEHDRITWLVDGKKTFASVDGIPHQQMYMLIQLALAGAPDPNIISPSLDIDYVRVYKRQQ